MSKKPSRYLITGGSGYVATSLVEVLKGPGVYIRRLDRPGRLGSIVTGPTVVEDMEGYVTSFKDIERATEGVEVIYHLASQTSVYVAEADPRADMQANVLPMLNILEACRSHGTKPAVFFAGTVTQVGMPEKLPVDES